MTWSIIARDASGAFGVAIATRFFAVGALCPHAESGVGALSTQALVNPHYGRQGLELLRSGVPAPEVVARLVAPDEGREHRQLHVIDAQGRIGQFTGAQCVDWCGAVHGSGFSVAGNMLANERVIRESARAYEHSKAPFPEKLIAVGEDRRPTAGVPEEHSLVGRDPPCPDQVHHPPGCFGRVDRVEQQPFQAGKRASRIDLPMAKDGVTLAKVVVDDFHLRRVEVGVDLE